MVHLRVPGTTEMTLTPDHKHRIRVCMVSLTGQISETGQKRVMTGQVQNPIVLYIVTSLKLGYVWVFVQLICRPMRTKNQLYKSPNMALLETSHYP